MENLYVKSESNFISKTLLLMGLGLLVTLPWRWLLSFLYWLMLNS